MCVHAELFRQESVGRRVFFDFVDHSAIWLANLASKGAIFVRGGVFESTLVGDNDTAVHGVHSNTVAFSPSVLMKCGICSYNH